MRYALMLMTCLFLLLGCTGSGPESVPAGPAQEDLPGANESAAPPAGAAPQAGNATPAEPPPAEAPQTESTTYSGTFSSIASMEIPLECDVSYTYAGREVQARLFINGESEIRVESPAGMTQCKKTVTLILGTRQYVGCEEKMIMPSCDWFKSSYDPENAGRASSFDFSSLPASQITCRDWEYDSSSFSAGGTVCQLG